MTTRINDVVSIDQIHRLGIRSDLHPQAPATDFPFLLHRFAQIQAIRKSLSTPVRQACPMKPCFAATAASASGRLVNLSDDAGREEASYHGNPRADVRSLPHRTTEMPDQVDQ